MTCAVAALFGIPLLKETYAPVICLRRAAKADPEKNTKIPSHLLQERGSKLHVLWVNLSRPIIILTHSFICFILSLYMALWVNSNPHPRAIFIYYSQSMYGLWLWNCYVWTSWGVPGCRNLLPLVCYLCQFVFLLFVLDNFNRRPIIQDSSTSPTDFAPESVGLHILVWV